MLRNIARNGRLDQMINRFALQAKLANLRRADRRGRHLDLGMRYFTLLFKVFLASMRHGICAECYQKCSDFQNFLIPMPVWEKRQLIRAKNQQKLGIGMLLPQLLKGVKGVTGATAQRFSRINMRLRQFLKMKLRHLKAVLRSAQATRFVPSLPHRQNQQRLQRILLNGCLRQLEMRQVWRVKRTAQDADPCRGFCAQTQSLRTR